MKRAMFVMVAGLGIGLMGCANDVDDPVPPAPTVEAQREPPRQALNTQLRDPQQELIDGIDVNHGFSNVPKQRIPGPQPLPNK